MKRIFSIVIPVYGNEQNLPVTIPYIVKHLDLFPEYDVELILVCDGSPDNSYQIMEEWRRQYPELIRTVKFTRNFGQGAAIRCGMEKAVGDVIGVISCDLQDPFELFADMLRAWEQGYKMVIASRQKRKDRGISAWESKCFHRFVHKVIEPRYPSGGFDFYVLDKTVADMFCHADIPNASMQMLLLWLGYSYKEIPYIRNERTIGKSQWNINRKMNAALGIVTSYSSFPLRLLGILGIFFAAAGTLGGICCIIAGLNDHSMSLAIPMAFLGVLLTGILLVGMWILGEYLWRVFDLVKGRPRYVVEESSDYNKEKLS